MTTNTKPEQTTPEQVLTAEAARAQFGAHIAVEIPGGGVFICRRPDLQTLLFRGVLALPTLVEVQRDLSTSDGDLDALVEQGKSQATNAFIDTWVCLASKQPRIVELEADAPAGSDQIWIGDVPFTAKMAIFGETFVASDFRRAAAAAEFRRQREGRATGSDGTPLSDSTESGDRDQ